MAQPISPALLSLATHSTDLFGQVLSWDLEELYRNVLAIVREQLGAEGCWFYSLEKEELVLEGGSSRRDSPLRPPARLSLADLSSRREWLGRAVASKQIVRLEPKDFSTSKKSEPDKISPTDRLPFHSIVAYPLLDRYGTCVGVFEVANKQAEESQTFTDEDAALGRVWAVTLSRLFSVFSAGELATQLFHDLKEARSLDAFHEAFLKVAVKLFQADRGDMVVWDAEKQSLVVRKSVGEGALLEGYEVDHNCVVRRVWVEQEYSLVKDVEIEDDYHELHESIRSELAIRWDVNDAPRGVLNLESCELAHFSETDVLLLQFLCRVAGVTYQILGKQIQLDSVYERLFAPSPSQAEVLETVLKSLLEIYRYEAGLVFSLSADRTRLECQASVGCREGVGFSYTLGESALATKVFETRAHLSVESKHDPALSPKGTDFFGIEGPVFGIPIRLNEEAEPVGVLVVWNNAEPSRCEPPFREFEVFGRVAAATIIQTTKDRQRERMVQEYQRIHSEILGQKDLDINLDSIARGIQDIAGFDRVRIYDFRNSLQRFECRAWAGMDDVPGVRGFAIAAEEGRYASDIVKKGKHDLAVRVYDPSTHPLGPDPDAADLGKGPEDSWAVLPLRNNGTVCGQIAADNAKSKRPITRDSLDTLTLLGGLASQAIANSNAEFEKRTRATLQTLLDKLVLDVPRELVIRWLLVYVTCGKAIGFSRALFLEQKEASQQLEYSTGLGSLSEKRFYHVATEAKDKSLDTLLEEARGWDDSELDRALDGFEITLDEVQDKELEGEAGAKSFLTLDKDKWPDWVRRLAERIGSEELLVARVGDTQGLFGYLVADRQWQARDISPTDVRVMEDFALRTAVLILRQYHLYHRILDNERLSNFGFVVEGLTHDLRQPVGALRMDTGTLVEAVEDEDMDAVAECTRYVDESVDLIVKTVRDLELLLRPETGTEDVDVPKLFDEVIDEIRKRTESPPENLRCEGADTVGRPRLIPQLLRRALANLVANSMEAMNRGGSSGTITMRIAPGETGWIKLEVEDQGPGISEADLDKVQQRGMAFTSKPGKGLGVGLEIVRRVAEAHQEGNRRGRMELSSVEGSGTTVELHLPIA